MMFTGKLKNSAIRNEYSYTRKNICRGYTGSTLYVDLSEPYITAKDISSEMKEKYVGGRGFGMKYLWDALKSGTIWNDPENEIIVSPGPLSGIGATPRKLDQGLR